MYRPVCHAEVSRTYNLVTGYRCRAPRNTVSFRIHRPLRIIRRRVIERMTSVRWREARDSVLLSRPPKALARVWRTCLIRSSSTSSSRLIRCDGEAESFEHRRISATVMRQRRRLLRDNRRRARPQVHGRRVMSRAPSRICPRRASPPMIIKRWSSTLPLARHPTTSHARRVGCTVKTRAS